MLELPAQSLVGSPVILYEEVSPGVICNSGNPPGPLRIAKKMWAPLIGGPKLGQYSIGSKHFGHTTQGTLRRKSRETNL